MLHENKIDIKEIYDQTDGLKKEVFIPLKINLRKGQKAYYFRSDDSVRTPLSYLLAKAYILQKRFLENPGISQTKFCKLNNISPRYMRGIFQFNFLSPKIKKMIMEGKMPKGLSTQQILTRKIPLLWKEQEWWFI